MDRVAVIEKIHNSDALGIFIEMGCGSPVAHELCKIAGASKTIFLSENPYAKEYSAKKYKFKGRAVSAETILQIAYYWRDLPENVNTLFISSFQLGEKNDKSTHGFIGIGYRGSPFKIYHISIHLSLTRTSYIEKITDVGLALLNNAIFPNEILNVEHVDIVYDSIKKTNIIDDKLQVFPVVSDHYDVIPNLSESLKMMQSGNDSQFLYVEKGIPYRLEELIRKFVVPLTIYKGSFNPVQNAHIEIMNIASYSEKNADGKAHMPIFSISSDIYEKGLISVKDLKWRIFLLNKLGYGVLINNSPYFVNMINGLRLKTKQPLIFPMGSDTYVRLSENYLDQIFGYNDIYLKVFDRNNLSRDLKYTHSNIEFIEFNREISSTEIRDLISNFEGDKKDLKTKIKNIPNEIIDDVINRFFW